MSDVSTTLPFDAANEMPEMKMIEVMVIPTRVAEMRFGMVSYDCEAGTERVSSSEQVGPVWRRRSLGPDLPRTRSMPR